TRYRADELIDVLLDYASEHRRRAVARCIPLARRRHSGGKWWGIFYSRFLGLLQSDPASAGPAVECAVELARAAGPAPLLSRSLAMTSIAAMMAGDHQTSRRLLDQAEATTTGLENDVSAMLMLLQARSLDDLFEGDLDAVRSAAASGGRLSREVGDLYSLEMMLINQGMVALMERDPAAAQPLFTEAP